MFFGISVCTFSFITAAGAGVVDISSVVVYLYSLEASSVIFKDSIHSDNTLILFIILELVLVLSRSLNYTCFISDR